MPQKKYASVLLDAAIDKPLDYEIPEALWAKALPGARVLVPLRNHIKPGFILAIKETADFFPVQPLASIEDQLILPDLLELAYWMQKYYCAPLRDVLKTMIPSTMRKNTKVKQQLYVMRGKTREELKSHCIAIRQKFPAQADVIDVLLKVKKGILLTELLEKTQGSRSPVDTLGKNGWVILDILKIDRSPHQPGVFSNQAKTAES